MNPTIINDSRQDSNQPIILHSANEMYKKEPKKINGEIFQEIYSDNDINEVNQINEKKENDYDNNTNLTTRREKRDNTIDGRKIGLNDGHSLDKYYNKYNFEQNYKRKQRRVMTGIERRLDRFKYFELEEDNSNKAAARIIFKKAKIKKFKSNRYELGPESNYPRSKIGTASLSKRRSRKDTKIFNFENNNKKIKHYISDTKKLNNHNLKKNHKKYLHMNNKNIESDEEDNNNKHYKTLTATRNLNKNKKVDINGTLNNNQNNSLKNKNQNKKVFTINTHFFKKRKINIIINKKFKEKPPTLNNTQSRLNKKLGFQEPHRKSNSLSRNVPRHIQIDKIPFILKYNYTTTNVREMDGVDNVKSRFKKRLIEIDNKLIDAIYYYKGPIDISCICPTINYSEAINELSKKMSKIGFKYINCINNFYKFNNGLDSLLVEIVKIRNNMLYYLLFKNQ